MWKSPFSNSRAQITCQSALRASQGARKNTRRFATWRRIYIVFVVNLTTTCSLWSNVMLVMTGFMARKYTLYLLFGFVLSVFRFLLFILSDFVCVVVLVSKSTKQMTSRDTIVRGVCHTMDLWHVRKLDILEQIHKVSANAVEIVYCSSWKVNDTSEFNSSSNL